MAAASGRRGLWAALVCSLVLAGCAELAPAPAVPVPPERPGDLAATEAPRPDTGPSARSRDLARYYERFEARQIAQGLLRTDGGGADTRFNLRMLEQNFERIAFFDEYQRGAGLRAADNQPGRLKRWTTPIRFTVAHGPWATEAVKAADRAEVARYVTRLQRITGHPMTMSDRNPNFHVIYANVDETPDLPDRIQRIVPNVNPASLAIFDTLPRNIHCLVIAFSSGPGGYDYAQSIAIIRAEHPPLMRRSCIHEEIAQGLGLANDSPRARPSIFNDDDEFALLTTHDEMLLRILYTPALRPGMSLEEARPIIRRTARSLLAGTRG